MAPDDTALTRLYEGVVTVLSEFTLEGVLDRIMDSVVEYTGAQRGFLVVQEKSGVEIRAARNLEQKDIENAEFEISRTLLHEVLERGRPLRHDDLEHSPWGKASASVRRLNIRSVLCIPLQLDGETRGSVYLDHPDPGRFSEEHEIRLCEFVLRVYPAVRNALRVRDLERRERRLRGLFAFDGIIGVSPALVSTLESAASVAAANVPVLLAGETGVGKEMIARAIHANSPRAEGPFVALNCAALTEPLLESELFGHVRGAFSGADRDRGGLFEAAHGGTLFLDEIGDTSAALQAKLLRAAQSGEVRRVGSDAVRCVDVRLVSATNKELADLIAEGRFRQDLYYRISTIKLTIPPLRERREDIPILAARFLQHFAEKQKKRLEGFEEEALSALVSYAYPGNIRELQNIVQHALLFARGPRVKVEDLPEPLRRSDRAPTGVPRTAQDLRSAKRQAYGEIERLFLTRALEAAKGSVTRAAEVSAMDRTRFQHLMSKHGLAAGDFQRPG